jgi:uncharacterized protein with PQ loop repeat
MVSSFFDLVVSPQHMASLSMLLYTLSFLPQIIENYKDKAGTGLSDYFLLAYLHTYMMLLFYIFSLHINIAYKIACPLQAVAVLILIGQRLYYNRQQQNLLRMFYLINILAYVIFVPFVLLYPTYMGHLLGWTSFVLGLINQLPQLLKVYWAQSFQGFSYLFVLIMGLAAVAEFYAAIKLGLPLQTICTAGKGCIFFICFSYLFVIYGKR